MNAAPDQSAALLGLIARGPGAPPLSFPIGTDDALRIAEACCVPVPPKALPEFLNGVGPFALPAPDLTDDGSGWTAADVLNLIEFGRHLRAVAERAVDDDLADRRDLRRLHWGLIGEAEFLANVGERHARRVAELDKSKSSLLSAAADAPRGDE
ncbi:hypothetical protein [Saccharicrinis sp. FJH54]|uniref:hypothetical protein n=1 Tax=Saccharicrinis sp. FJH54 TaxID=3344665 RepID=UPI0035D4F8D3